MPCQDSRQKAGFHFCGPALSPACRLGLADIKPLRRTKRENTRNPANRIHFITNKLELVNVPR